MSPKAGVVQFSPQYGQPEHNLQRLEALVVEGVRQGAQLLVLPEMAWTGYLWPDEDSIRPFCERAHFGPGQNRLIEWSRKYKVWLVYGFPEIAPEGLFNAQTVARPDGLPSPIYRKTHLFQADYWWSQPGNSGFLQWPSPWGNLGAGICMDLNYSDFVEFHGNRGTDILAFSTNWIDQDFDVVPYWETSLQASENRSYLGWALFADRGGEEFGVRFRGQSAIFHQGRCVAALDGTKDAVLVVSLTPR